MRRVLRFVENSNINLLRSDLFIQLWRKPAVYSEEQTIGILKDYRVHEFEDLRDIAPFSLQAHNLQSLYCSARGVHGPGALVANASRNAFIHY